jgi:hypothetical protein
VEQYAGKPFVLLGVNSDEDREALNKTLIEERITWRSWWDDGRIDGPIHTTWQIDLRPAIHLLDHKGVIRYRDIPPDKVDSAIAKLLEELTAEK